MNIIEWIVSEKLATNAFAASHLANGLKLATIMHDEEAQKERVRLYRRWRDATKDSPAKCYEYVLQGKEPPAELFDGLSDKEYAEAFVDEVVEKTKRRDENIKVLGFGQYQKEGK